MHKYKIVLNGTEKVLGYKIRFFKNHLVFLDGIQIGEFKNSKECKEGKNFDLDHSNVVNIKYTTSFLTQEVHVALNGQPLETSANHPVYKKKAAFVLICLLAVLNLAIGAVGFSNAFETLTQSGYGIYNLCMGLFYVIAIGLFKKSDPFLGIALALAVYSVDSIVVIASISQNPGIVGAVFVRIMFFTAFIKGVKSSWPRFKEVFVEK